MTLFSEFLKRRSKPKISFPSFFAFRRGVRGEPEKIERKIFGFATRESASASEARSSAIGAYLAGSSHHARGACEVSRSAAGNGFAQRLVCQHTSPRNLGAGSELWESSCEDLKTFDSFIESVNRRTKIKQKRCTETVSFKSPLLRTRVSEWVQETSKLLCSCEDLNGGVIFSVLGERKFF